MSTGKGTILFLLLFSLLCLPFSPAMGASPTGSPSPAYGHEANDTGDPVGGGPGYSRIFSGGTFEVSSLPELLAALNAATPGSVVYITSGTVIDVNADNPQAKVTIFIPPGVTLAGDRGLNGSPGPLIKCSNYDTAPLIELSAGARLTGLRIEGPDGEAGESATWRPNSRGVDISGDAAEVDNCEIYNWSHAGVNVKAGEAYIHHNSIHHVRRTGLGYGVLISRGTALIEANVFDWFRCAVAGTGFYGTGYEARYNLTLDNAAATTFDMHGGTNFCPSRSATSPCTEEEIRIAGDYVRIHHNTIMAVYTRPIGIKGVPTQELSVYGNRFATSDPSFAFKQFYFDGGNTKVYDNMYGMKGIVVPEQYSPSPFIRQCPQTTCNGKGPIVALAPSATDRHLKFINPPEDAAGQSTFTGLLPVELSINVGEDFRANSYTLMVDDDGGVIYQKERPPIPGEVTIDTTSLADGRHKLEIVIGNATGDSIRRHVYFLVDNKWEIVDNFDAPIYSPWFGWIGAEKTLQASSGWTYAEDSEKEFWGDAGRRVIKAGDSAADAEYLIWQADGLSEYRVVLYVARMELAGNVTMAVSADNATWTTLPIEMTVEAPSSPAGNRWHKVELFGSVPTGVETGYVRLQLLPPASADELQLGAVILSGKQK